MERRRLLLLLGVLPACTALSVGVASAPARCAALRAAPPTAMADDEAFASAAAAAAPPAQWFEEDAGQIAPPPPPAAAEEAEPQEAFLEEDDLVNTMWDIVATAREESWLTGDKIEQQFTLLSDSSVVWGGQAGGFGTGGTWTIKEGLLEVKRTTAGNLPGVSLLFGRDYYMANARVEVNSELQFQIKGVIRSYNALYPVMVIADFEATRRPGRFVRDIADDDE